MTEYFPTLIFKDYFHSLRSSIPSCIKFLATSDNYKFKLPFINILHKFSGSESEYTYVFINEFKKICIMIKIQQLSGDAIKVRFIPFTLKDNTKKRFHNILTNSISIPDEFVNALLKNFYPFIK